MMPTLAEIEALARQAGAILRDGYIARPGFGDGLAVRYKSLIDPVTEVDRRSEAFILEAIRRRYPDHRIIAEESGGKEGSDCCAWYVDPLDGTVNFSHGIPIFTVSIGFAQEGRLSLGVVYDPLRDECFSAEHGKGAWLNGESIRAAVPADLDHSLLVTGFPYDIRTNPRNNLDLYALFSLRSQGVRRLGAASLDLCYVAAGRFDGYWELYLEPWDLAAGVLVAQEASARVSTCRGDQDFFSPPCSVLASSPAIYSQMLEILSADG